LHDGIPDHLWSTVWEFIRFALNENRAAPHHYWSADERLSGFLIRKLQWPITVSGGHEKVEAIKALIWGNRDNGLDLLDLLCLMDEAWFRLTSAARDELRTVLCEGGSLWTVTPGSNGGLVQVVTDEATAALAVAVEPGDPAAQHLSTAWSAAYGRHPDPSTAWNSAIKAVESLLQPIVSPDDSKATLGKMKGALRDQPAKWRFALADSDENEDGSGFLTTLGILGYEPGRHGSDNRDAPSLEQARVVVLQAVAVVETLRMGALERV
jgi:hypothetical protein